MKMNAAGTNILHPLFGCVRVEHFNNAEQQGRTAARALLGILQSYDYIYSFWSDQYEEKIEYVGYASRWIASWCAAATRAKPFWPST
jgi:hypothetical protein